MKITMTFAQLAAQAHAAAVSRKSQQLSPEDDRCFCVRPCKHTTEKLIAMIGLDMSAPQFRGGR